MSLPGNFNCRAPVVETTVPIALERTVDPRQTYLIADKNPSNPDNPSPPEIGGGIIDLAALNLFPGDVIHLDTLGDFGFTQAEDPEQGTRMIGVFSEDGEILGNNPNRRFSRIARPVTVPGRSVHTGPTFEGGHITDIAEDFEIDGSELQIPEGGRFLIVSALDVFYPDNRDADENFRLRITEGPDISVVGADLILDGDSSPSALDGTHFGEAPLGETPGIFRTFRILNEGALPLSVDRISVTGEHADDFAVEGFSDVLLQVGASMEFVVRFRPLFPGSRSARIEIESNDPDESPFDFAVEGVAVGPRAVVYGNGRLIGNGDRTPTSADGTFLGQATVGQDPQSASFSIFNEGGGVLEILNIDIIHDWGRAFSVGQDALPVSVRSGEFAEFQVVFRPRRVGYSRAKVQFHSNDPSRSRYTFAIIGRGEEVDRGVIRGRVLREVFGRYRAFPNVLVVVEKDGAVVGETRSNSRGDYLSAETLPRGTYIVRAEAGGFAPIEVSVDLDRSSVRKNFYFNRPEPPPAPVSWVRGAIANDGAEMTISNIRVSAFSDGRQIHDESAHSGGYSVPVSDEVFDGNSEVDIAIEVSAPAYLPFSSIVSVSRDETLERDFALIRDPEIAGGDLLGEVYDGATDGLLGEVWVHARNLDQSQPWFRVSTDESGRFRFNDLPVGDYQVLVAKPGYLASDWTEITVTEDAELILDFQLVLNPNRDAGVLLAEPVVASGERPTLTVSWPDHWIDPALEVSEDLRTWRSVDGVTGNSHEVMMDQPRAIYRIIYGP